VHPQRRTPVNAIFAFIAIATVIILVWALLHLIGGAKQSGEMNALNFFDDSSTMGTILVLVVYFLSNLALPFYYRRYRPREFNAVKHVLLPVLGIIAVGVPMYYLVKPGQSAPLNWFPYAALGVIVVSVGYAIWLSRRDPGLGDRVGSIVADE
jgi:amino acid transporter